MKKVNRQSLIPKNNYLLGKVVIINITILLILLATTIFVLGRDNELLVSVKEKKKQLMK